MNGGMKEYLKLLTPLYQRRVPLWFLLLQFVLWLTLLSEESSNEWFRSSLLESFPDVVVTVVPVVVSAVVPVVSGSVVTGFVVTVVVD